MRSTDFGPIVSPIMLARDHRGRFARGGHVQRTPGKGKHHLTIIVGLPPLLGVLAHVMAMHHAAEAPTDGALKRRLRQRRK